MIQFSQKRSRLHRKAAGLLAAAILVGMAPPQAGLNIIAITGSISTPSPNIVGGGDITTIFNRVVTNWELADPDQEWTVCLSASF